MEPGGSKTAAEVIYVGDPMCSWCWGIAPELDALIDAHPDVPLRIVVGGLRPGPNAQTVDAAMADMLLHHWRDVEARTGQPFDRSVFDELGWLYDTEPACRAVVVMRDLAPHETFRFFKRIQRAFYAEGQPVWDPTAFETLIEGLDLDPMAFMDRFNSQEAIRETWQDFSLARSWGISGFPTVVLRTGNTGTIIARGYSTAADMTTAMSEVLAQAAS